jgi:hypothetical protein
LVSCFERIEIFFFHRKNQLKKIKIHLSLEAMGCLKLDFYEDKPVRMRVLMPSHEANMVLCWLSIDPLAEKMPAWSPYSFCFNNPMKFVDPDGREPYDDYKLLKNGKVELIAKTDSKTDRIYNQDRSKSIEVDKGFVNKKLITNNLSFFVTTNSNQAKEAYKFFADNSNVEFSLAVFSKNKDTSVILTTYDPDKLNETTLYSKLLSKNGINLKYHSHSHPGKYDSSTGWPAYPSGFNSNLSIDSESQGDRNFYWSLNHYFPKRIPKTFNVYVPDAQNIDINYDFYEVARNIKK